MLPPDDPDVVRGAQIFEPVGLLKQVLVTVGGDHQKRMDRALPERVDPRGRIALLLVAEDRGSSGHALGEGPADRRDLVGLYAQLFQAGRGEQQFSPACPNDAAFAATPGIDHRKQSVERSDLGISRDKVSHSAYPGLRHRWSAKRQR